MMDHETSNPCDGPIGVFDSGLGGLTVVKELRRVMPTEDIVYLGDSARVPYGIKSPETIRRFALEDAAFLQRLDPKLIVVACNTASAAAVDVLRERCAAPVVDVIGPGVAAAVKMTGGTIGVMATEATVASGAYQRAIASADGNNSREVVAVACPLLVPIVEEGRSQDDPIVLHVLCDYLRDLQRVRPGAMILGCTHYPLLSEAISKLMGPGSPLVDSARATALEVQRVLCDTQRSRRLGDGHAGVLRCYTTDSAERFARVGRRFGGEEINWVRRVGTDELERLAPSQAAGAMSKEC